MTTILFMFIVVFSTCVEVILSDYYIVHVYSGILHVCGGDPNNHQFRIAKHTVFSTCVEVILIFNFGLSKAKCILHVCGGDPKCWN